MMSSLSVPQHRISVLSRHLLSDANQPSVELDPCSAKSKDEREMQFLYSILTPEEEKIRKTVRDFTNQQIAPVIEKYCEEGKFPFELIPKIAELKLAGADLKGYGCPGLTAVQSGLIALELARKSVDIATFFGILQNIVMIPIHKYGSEEQKQKYLPQLASLSKIGAFALTEPEAGSDASNLKSTAKKVEGGWILNGEKRWIGNGTFADVCVVWARNEDTKKVNGFIVEPKTVAEGTWIAKKIEGKFAVRAIQNAHIEMKACFVPDSQRLPLATDFSSGPGGSLFLTRILASFIAVGVALGAYEECKSYVLKRKQFGQPLAKMQIVQERLVKMISNIQAMFMMSWRVATLYDKKEVSFGQIGITKSHNTLRGREVVAMARELFGGNGILGSYSGRHFTDMEAVHSYEGSYDVNILISGREITGLSAFK
eukprot:TRINITY_DN10169_c0_g1_i1.p1 TRINITY_DN10169_c0_g1~~TRINITY_DN10169_c0_g1_i1.p1  ORF type:complete len:445 (-),score=94.32 TRINITY_DN10169_c0_g1_i1:71-1354(-)